VFSEPFFIAISKFFLKKSSIKTFFQRFCVSNLSNHAFFPKKFFAKQNLPFVVVSPYPKAT